MNLHVGRKLMRIREMRGVNQEVLAESLGMSKQAVSKLEQSETIDEITLSRIAKALQVTPEQIKSFLEEGVIYNIQNNYDNASNNQGPIGPNHQCTFNPLDEYRNAMNENKKLYEALLKEKEEKIELLKKMLDSKQ